MKTKLEAMIQWIASRGVTPDDGEDRRLRKGIFNVAAFLACVTFVVLIGPFYLWFHEPVAGWAYILFGAFICVSLAFVDRLWGTYERFFTVISWMALPLHLLVYISLGGFVESGGIFLWGLAHPVMSSLIVNGPRSALRWFAAYFINLLIGISLTSRLIPSPNLPPLVKFTAFGLSLGLISFVITMVLTNFVSQLEQAYQLLHTEQEKAENLLLNILPKDIAAILKNDQSTIANSFESASILFADVVNFTPLSAEMSPVELVDLLNEVFSHFDNLVEEHHLEKIKTIGDCYMVAAGVPRPRADHASVLTQLALEMRDFVSQHEFRGRKLAFRIGINSGPVVAGVIGRKKFIYDLWGDAVNTASRMESQGQAGTVQITRATYELVHDDFVCEPQGTVKVKGKGEMEVWFVVGRKGAQ
jgi:adenylate cyclase